MTSKQKKLSTPTKPAPVELHDEALDRAQGGISPRPFHFIKVIDKASP